MASDLFSAFRVEVGMHVPTQSLDPLRRSDTSHRLSPPADDVWPTAVTELLRDFEIKVAALVTPQQMWLGQVGGASILHPGATKIPWSKVDEVCETGDPRDM